MTEHSTTKKRSWNFLAGTSFGKYINRIVCNHFLYAHFDAIDRFFLNVLIHPDKIFTQTLENSIKGGLPVMNVSANQGKLLQLIIMAAKAERILEIGTLGGYSTIWMAQGMQKDGKLISLEYDPSFAKVAKENIANAGLGSLVEIRTGQAVDSLAQMEKEKVKSFDFIFIDADKNNYPIYLEYALKFSHSGTIIMGDNMVHEEQVLDKNNKNPDAKGIRRFIELLGSDPRINATAIQTIGSKWHDGFALAIVK